MKSYYSVKIAVMAILLLIDLSISCFGEEAVIEIKTDEEIGGVNKKVFGNNFIGYDPVPCKFMSGEFYGYSDYGAGIWDSQKRAPVKEVIDLAVSSGMTVVRFPGGCGSHHYDWKKTIGVNRTHFLYGIDEFLKTCKAIGAEPVITISYFTGDERDAADLVEYLNSLNDGSNSNGGVDWASERAKNGYAMPYNVKYFEIGNEIDHGDHANIKGVLPKEYASRYLEYYKAMKAVDPSIKIGLVFRSSNWNKKVAEMARDKADFVVIHAYPGVGTNELEKWDVKNIFKITLGAGILKTDADIKDAISLLKAKPGKDIHLAITEYNAGFVQEKPIPYRHCLGTALVNAELLKLFMKPENNILMANYWQFMNEYWGMISNGFSDNYQGLKEPYYKRPNYYVFELYHKHFGDVLLATDTKCDSYSLGMKKVPFLSVNASKNKNGTKIYIMVVNKNLDKGIEAKVVLKDFVPMKMGSAWILNGPAVEATNEVERNNVRIINERLEMNNDYFLFTFKPHSVTAIEIQKNENSNNRN